MSQDEKHWDILDEMGLDGEEKQTVIDFIRGVVQNVVDRHFGLSGLQEVSYDE